jgi:hypothetical protein
MSQFVIVIVVVVVVVLSQSDDVFSFSQEQQPFAVIVSMEEDYHQWADNRVVVLTASHNKIK